jgi:hypothetical protein
MQDSEYEAALAKANEASATFRAAQRKYRAREIGDAEFLEARSVFLASEREFDEARGESA